MLPAQAKNASGVGRRCGSARCGALVIEWVIEKAPIKHQIELKQATLPSATAISYIFPHFAPNHATNQI